MVHQNHDTGDGANGYSTCKLRISGVCAIGYDTFYMQSYACLLCAETTFYILVSMGLSSLVSLAVFARARNDMKLHAASLAVQDKCSHCSGCQASP